MYHKHSGHHQLHIKGPIFAAKRSESATCISTDADWHRIRRVITGNNSFRCRLNADCGNVCSAANVATSSGVSAACSCSATRTESGCGLPCMSARSVSAPLRAECSADVKQSYYDKQSCAWPVAPQSFAERSARHATLGTDNVSELMLT